MWTNVRVRVFNAGLLARSQFASGKSCDLATLLSFSVVFFDPRAFPSSTKHLKPESTPQEPLTRCKSIFLELNSQCFASSPWIRDCVLGVAGLLSASCLVTGACNSISWLQPCIIRDTFTDVSE
jgi:hypothetical protein